MVYICKYTDKNKEDWNLFNNNARKVLFMFNRNYMDYHNDRFTDHSLMFYNEKNELIAILPMCEKDNKLLSHGGLTYGGFITNGKMRQHTMNECFEELKKYAKKNHFKEIYYKMIPHMYSNQPAEEDKYSLFINGAQLVKAEPSTVINLKSPLKMPKGRKAQISRAKRENVEVKELISEEAFAEFINLENEVLSEHHNTKAVHTIREIILLHNRFPENIHLFAGVKNNKIIAGTIVFEYDKVVHTQYMAANDMARKIGALDLVINNIVDKYKDNKDWLDFGISTENGGLILNNGLISQKEGFGGRTNIYETWNWEVK